MHYLRQALPLGLVVLSLYYGFYLAAIGLVLVVVGIAIGRPYLYPNGESSLISFLFDWSTNKTIWQRLSFPFLPSIWSGTNMPISLQILYIVLLSAGIVLVSIEFIQFKM